MTKTKTELLARRFGRRLRSALDLLGYPSATGARATMISEVIECEPAAASGMLSGTFLPDWTLLLRLCDATNRQPGYFLDDVVNHFPTQTRFVKALGIGDDIVVSLPGGHGRWGEPEDDWVYIRATAELGNGVAPGDYLICYIPRRGPIIPDPQALFLAGSDNRFELYRCGEITRNCVALVPSIHHQRDEVPHLLRIDNATQGITQQVAEKAGFYFFGVVAAVLRSSEVLIQGV